MKPDALSWRSRGRRPSLVLFFCAFAWFVSAYAEGETSPGDTDDIEPGLSVLSRHISQRQGSWQIDYRVRYDGSVKLMLSSKKIFLRLTGGVSNSRVPGHQISSGDGHRIDIGGDPLRGETPIPLPRTSPGQCREEAVLEFLFPGKDSRAPFRVELAPGEEFEFRLILNHRHLVYGDYDPLLGARTLDLRLGGPWLRDRIPLLREHYFAVGQARLKAPSPERLDDRNFYSAPNAILLQGIESGNQLYRFDDLRVRYSTKMRLRFFYYVEAGSEAPVHLKLSQFSDGPDTTRYFGEADIDTDLPVEGRWAKYERVFTVRPDANLLRLQLYFYHSKGGDAWVDDVTLEPSDGLLSQRYQP